MQWNSVARRAWHCRATRIRCRARPRAKAQEAAGRGLHDPYQLGRTGWSARLAVAPLVTRPGTAVAVEWPIMRRSQQHRSSQLRSALSEGAQTSSERLHQLLEHERDDELRPEALRAQFCLRDWRCAPSCRGGMTLRTGTSKGGRVYRYYTCSNSATKGKTVFAVAVVPSDCTKRIFPDSGVPFTGFDQQAGADHFRGRRIVRHSKFALR